MPAEARTSLRGGQGLTRPLVKAMRCHRVQAQKWGVKRVVMAMYQAESAED